MTPPAVTSAGRGGQRSKLRPRQPPGPRAPRRVSGPVSRPQPGVSRPQVSRPRPVSRPATRPALGGRALSVVRGLPDHQLLDRIVRGRAWIPLLGLLLAGIVAMQVEVLKLGAGIGRSINRSTELQSRNESLRASVATLADDRRIETLAVGLGMVMPPPDAVSYLSLHSVAGLQRAEANIHPPDPAAFTARLPADATTTPAPATGAPATGSAVTSTPATAGVAVTTSTPVTTSAPATTSSTGG